MWISVTSQSCPPQDPPFLCTPQSLPPPLHFSCPPKRSPPTPFQLSGVAHPYLLRNGGGPDLLLGPQTGFQAQMTTYENLTNSVLRGQNYLNLARNPLLFLV